MGAAPARPGGTERDLLGTGRQPRDHSVVARSARQRGAAPPAEASQAAAWLGGDIDAALADIRVPAFILAADGVIRWQNARATELIGDGRGRHFSSVVAPESLHQAKAEFAKQVIGGVRTSARDVVLRSSAGTRSSVEVHSVSLEDGRRVVGVFGIMDVDAVYPSPPPLRQTLTPRQHQVLVELARGASTDQIAASLGVARETARNHVRGLLQALQVHSRIEAVAEARRRGLLGP
jgi:DNA-binding NarL/FixJ family response regulator